MIRNLRSFKTLGFALSFILLIKTLHLFKLFHYDFKLFDRSRSTPSVRISKSSPPYLCALPYFKESPIPEKSRVKLICEAKNEVKVLNGRLLIRDPDSVWCFHNDIVRLDDYRTNISDNLRPFRNGSLIPSDYFKVSCFAKRNLKQSFEMPLAGVVQKKNILSKRSKIEQTDHSFGVNVAFLGFDSTSRLSFIRNLPKSYDYFTKKMDGVVLQKHNIIGDGTTVNLLGILTGFKETELPEARKSKKNAKPVDHFPWIFKKFKSTGYMTMHAEDNQFYGTFQYRLLGFKNPPVDHYYRPYFLQYPYKKGCLGSTPRHQVMFNIMKEYYTAYKEPVKKFSFVFHSESSHDNNSLLHPVDSDLVHILKEFKPSGLFDNTILFLFGDHGARYSKQRAHLQGKYEERLPFVGIYLPSNLRKKRPYLMKLLRKNSQFLTSHLDIHATLLHILGERRSKDIHSQSLFDEISHNRTCADLKIDVHWCACTRWTKYKNNHPLGVAAAESAIRYINSLVEPLKHLCVKLKVGKIKSLEHYQTNRALLAYKKTADNDGYTADMSDKMKAEMETFRVSFSVTPSDGVFEVTANYYAHNKTFATEASQISRINRYAPWIKCLNDQYPHLSKYCICKSAL